MSEFVVGTEIRTHTGKLVATVTEIDDDYSPPMWLDNKLDIRHRHYREELLTIIERLDLVVVPPKPTPREFEDECVGTRRGLAESGYARVGGKWVYIGAHEAHPSDDLSDDTKARQLLRYCRWPDGHTEEFGK